MSMGTQETQLKNPYSRGKARMLTDLIYKGLTNEEILGFVEKNDLARRYKNGVDKRDLWNIRAELKKAGYLDVDGFPKKTKPADSPDTLPVYPIEGVPDETGKVMSEEKGVPQPRSITRRPDWDVLTVEQVERLGDPKLKMEILNYKTEIDKLRQELKPEYATRGEIDLLRTEVVSRFGGVEEKINTLLSKFDEPEPEGEEEEEEEPEPEEAEVETPRKAPKLVTRVNPLDEEATEGEDEIIEVEGSIVARKYVGLTSKSMMLYDLAKTEGFPGNLADFINSCIGDAYKGRNIELAVIDKRVIR